MDYIGDRNGLKKALQDKIKEIEKQERGSEDRRMNEIKVLVLEHGSAYFVRDKRLMCSPMLQNGMVEDENETEVEESPHNFKETHEQIAKFFGMAKEDLEKQNIQYYEEPISFGQAEFKIICEPLEVRLEIYGGEVVARANKDVYSKLFDYCVKELGGRLL